MLKKRITICTILLIAVVALLVCLVSAMNSPLKQHDPYSHRFSSLKAAINFSMSGENRYFGELKTGEENILLFWGSWCPHCESLIKTVDQMSGSETIKKNLFTVAEDVGLDDIENHRGDFPIYLDQDKSVYNSFELEHIPTVFILTDRGAIIGSSEGEKDSLELLKEYVAYNK